MSRKQRALDPIRAAQFVISCEHASNRLPAKYGGLGLDPKHLGTHIAWDRGAKEIARALAKLLGRPRHEGAYSRLLIDLNRSLHHRHLIARESGGIRVPGNTAVSPEERQTRVRLYYAPYREEVLADIQDRVRRVGRCVHLSVHSFTPWILGRKRMADYGILFDPRRSREKELALLLARRLRAAGRVVRLNSPYRGVSDGFTTHCRKLFRPSRYLGLEIEVNQKLLRDHKSIRQVAREFSETVAGALSR